MDRGWPRQPNQRGNKMLKEQILLILIGEGVYTPAHNEDADLLIMGEITPAEITWLSQASQEKLMALLA